MLQYGLASKALCWENKARQRRPHIVWCHLQEMFRTDRSGETESRWLFSGRARGCGEKERGATANEFQNGRKYLKIIHLTSYLYQNKNYWASLVLQWLESLQHRGSGLIPLVPISGCTTCCGATKPLHNNYLTLALEPHEHNYWSHAPQLLKL